MRTCLPILLCLAFPVVLAAQFPDYVIFGTGCGGSMPVSRLVLVSPPTVGSTMQVDVTNLPFNLAFMVTGLSRTSSPLGPLPMDLSPIGMPGCVAYVSPDNAVLMVGGGNRANYTLPIPSISALVGVQLFQQALIIDFLAGNAASAIVSDAAMAVAGPELPAGMVPIWAGTGTFLMGSNAGPPDNVAPYYPQPHERPVHQVTVSRPFWIGRYEVTQAEYQAVMNVNPAYFQGLSWPNSGSRPVEQVSWSDAMAYCAALTSAEGAAGRLPIGYQYRLPTEAEWEYCCRAGTTTEYHYGPSLACGQANLWESHHSRHYCSSTGDCPNPLTSCNTGTVVVGRYAPNLRGLYDMHGNVWEWCLDAWDGSAPYSAGSVVDPYVTTGPYRVFRGGGWRSDSRGFRSGARYGYNPTYRSFDLGFRVVLAPVLVP